MGDLILLSERRLDRSRPGSDLRPAFFFDLACPFSYLAAERIERLFGDVDWIPVASAVLEGDLPAPSPERVRAAAERRAEALRLSLVWPERFPADAPRALRAAAHAAEVGAGSRFALAAGRLAFCGGFDLEDPEALAEAAGAAGIGLEQCLAAACETGRDRELHATARGLGHRGVRRLPAIRLGQRFFAGEVGLVGAAAMLRTTVPDPVFEGPLAPLA